MSENTMKMKDAPEIIDFAVKGNAIRFYLGKNGEQWGDDWDDVPYEHNAGTVYDEYVQGTQDIFAPFDCFVLQPSDGCWEGNSAYSKKDMIDNTVPCIIIVPASMAKGSYYDSLFDYWAGCKGVKKIYFGDKIDRVKLEINALYLDATREGWM